MIKTFPKPKKPEELYEFFTYGLALTPTDWRHVWWVNATHNTIKRRTWYADITYQAGCCTVEYQAGLGKNKAFWYMPEWKYDYVS